MRRRKIKEIEVSSRGRYIRNIADIPRYMKLPAQDGGNINAVCSNSQ